MHDSAVDGQEEDQVGTGPPFNASGCAAGDSSSDNGKRLGKLTKRACPRGGGRPAR